MGDGQFVALCVGVFLTALFAFLSWVAIFWGNIDRSNLLKEIRSNLASIRNERSDPLPSTSVEKYDLAMIRRISMSILEETGKLSATVDKLDKDLLKHIAGSWQSPPVKDAPKPVSYRVQLIPEDKQ